MAQCIDELHEIIITLQNQVSELQLQLSEAQQNRYCSAVRKLSSDLQVCEK